jgi:hypothetical protein
MGPLLYDIAMELSGEHGLTADRWDVTRDARRVWDFYLKNRSDVDTEQLDSLEDELTPGIEIDNCDQDASRRHTKKWFDSPLSKVFKARGTPTIDALKRLGLIEFA